MLVGMNLLMNKGSRVPIYGKMISVVVPCLLGCGFAGARSWKNDEGKSIEAELVGVRGDSAVLKMGAREFVAPSPHSVPRMENTSRNGRQTRLLFRRRS